MKFLKDNKGLSDSILRAIEQFWGVGLPENYRNFLIEHNGGEPENKIFKFQTQADGSCLDQFFGVVRDYNNNLLMKYKYLGDRVMDTMLPIARDVYGNLILLTVKGKDRNKVYFWDHEMEADTENGEKADYSNLTLIADSFTEFVEGLRAEDQDD